MAKPHTHSGPPGNITQHLRAHAPNARVDALPNGTPARHAMHERLHGGDLSKPATPVAMSSLIRAAVKGRK